MQKFDFRLESVLRLRSLRLKMAREKLARALSEANAAEQAIAAIATERTAAITFVQNEPGAGATELRALSAYLLGYEGRLAALRQSLEAARVRVAEQRQRVLSADRDERLLLKLKDNRRAVWKVAADHELEVLAQESWNAVHFDRDA